VVIIKLSPAFQKLNGSKIVVTACGRLCLHRKRINISTVLAGQKLGIKEVDEGIWLISFMHYDLGYFDLEQKTLQPLDNPFGPKPITAPHERRSPEHGIPRREWGNNVTL
jgi:hypothetical protein